MQNNPIELPTLYQDVIYKTRYARWLDDFNRREHLGETVERYTDYLKSVIKEKSPDSGLVEDEQLWGDIEESIINLEAMPSMRSLMTSGPALMRCHVAAYNCSYLPVDHVRAFDECMYILMCGTGVGFSVERQYISKLPEVSEHFEKTDTVIVVKDSKAGWARALKELIHLLYSGQIPTWDTSQLRPAGARLKTFGGRSSGPVPLENLFRFTCEVFQKASGRRLNSIECHDIMCKIGDVVVVGGVRRSALISLSNLSDERMRTAKSGRWYDDNPQRALSNNSVAYTEKPDIEIFMKEWLSLVESKSGERGIFNREAAFKKVESIGRDTSHEFGCNPCCFTGDMRLLTNYGYLTFKELEGNSVKIINKDGTKTLGKVWKAGYKDTVKLKFSTNTGKEPITCTPDHVFMTNEGEEIEAKDLKGKRLMPYFNIKEDFTEDAFFAGFIQGDGNTTRLLSNVHKGLEVNIGERDQDISDMLDLEVKGRTAYSRRARQVAEEYNLEPEILPYRELPSNFMDLTASFYSGLYSANGSVLKVGRVTYKSTCHGLIKQLQTVLKEKFDIASYITVNKATEIEHSNGTYTSRESYDLNIAKHSEIMKFAEKISFGQQYKRDHLEEIIKNKGPFVTKVEEHFQLPVYDFTEPSTHWGVVEGVVVHNSEIILRPKQMCNLSEVVVRKEDTKETLKDKVRIATILGTFQSLLTDFKYLRKVWKDNTEEERLLGVSLTGIMDNPELMKSPGLLKELREYSREVNAEYADKLGISRSAAITCVKPSGSVSQMTDSSSGIHTRHSPFYIRTVRGDKKDPITQFLIDKGVPYEDDVTKPEDTVVFSFPIKAPSGSVTRADMDSIEQLEFWKMVNEEWCDHKPSITVSVKENDWLKVGSWVYDNFDDISGISFLPYSEHTYAQAPYQECTEEEYLELLEKMPEDISWDGLSEYEKEDKTTGSQELACSSGVCEVVDFGA